MTEGKQGFPSMNCGFSLVPAAAYRGLKKGPFEGKTSVVKIIPFYYISCFLSFRNTRKRSEGLACGPQCRAEVLPACVVVTAPVVVFGVR